MREASCHRRLLCELNDACSKGEDNGDNFQGRGSHAEQVRYRSSRVLLICLTVSVLSIGVQAEQAVTRRWEARSALHTFFSGHLVRLTVFEAGAATVASRAVIELRDRANRVVARKEGTLRPNRCSWI